MTGQTDYDRQMMFAVSRFEALGNDGKFILRSVQPNGGRQVGVLIR
ncbi:MAG: hypothetical protein WBB29_12595 [Geitlerinemataceae cyanobacterium]